MSTITIEHATSPIQVELQLEKAVSHMKLDRDKQRFKDTSLKELKVQMDTVRTKVIDAMIQEISEIIADK